MGVKFYELAVGAVFHFGGARFKKIAMSMASDEQRCGNIFGGETDVESEGPFLPAEIAAGWKPPDIYWTENLGRAPGQREGELE